MVTYGPRPDVLMSDSRQDQTTNILLSHSKHRTISVLYLNEMLILITVFATHHNTDIIIASEARMVLLVGHHPITRHHLLCDMCVYCYARSKLGIRYFHGYHKGEGEREREKYEESVGNEGHMTAEACQRFTHTVSFCISTVSIYFP